MTVPTSESSGLCGPAGFGGTLTGAAAGGPTTADVSGRREGEKIGRSRVLDNCLSGMAHSGLAGNSRPPGSSVGASGANRTLGA